MSSAAQIIGGIAFLLMLVSLLWILFWGAPNNLAVSALVIFVVGLLLLVIIGVSHL